MIPGITDLHSTRILSIFQAMPQGSQVILFGSRAKGNYREGSDIDLSVKGAGFTLQDRDLWLEKYESLNLPWKLDLVIYDLIEEPELKAHIDRVGKSLVIK